MSLRDEVLRDFRASFDRLQTVRACGNTEVERQELRHAQRNFDAAAESLARLVPKLIDGPGEVGGHGAEPAVGAPAAAARMQCASSLRRSA
ncbi:hypothetical protein [Citromicrobium sp. JLT1363]|uniref:hypothetical protein n=1 Tax=Citromicrobium sp. JLT1363 TaxID=517722 RepID=UPI0002FA0092|nr:hypothetical protein [Citromicrobium sp. JLT1363]